MRSPARLLAIPLTLTLLSACGNEAPAADPAPPAPPATAVATPPPAAPPPPPATAPPPAPVVQATSIGATMPAVDLARAILELPLAADRAGLQAVSTDALSFQLVLPPGTDPARATAVAHALGDVPTASVAWPATGGIFGVELLEVHGEALLHEAPSATSHAHAKLPDGAFFVSFLGTLSVGPSAREGEHAWAYGFTSSGLSGWVEAAHVGVEPGCVIGRAGLAHALSMRAHDEELETFLLGNLHLVRDGRRHDGSFVIGEHFVATIVPHANCASAALDLRIDVEERPEEFHHALDREHGDTFLAIAMPPQNGDDASTWMLFPPRATEPVESISLRSGWTVPMRSRDHIHFGPTRGPAGAHGHWAYSIAHGRDPATFYTSDGTAFTEVPSEEAAP